MSNIVNLEDKIVKPWGWGTVIPRLPILNEDVQVCSIGHAFGKIPDDLPAEEPTYFVHDFLIDQSQSTNGGSALSELIQCDFTQSPGYRYTIYPSHGKKIRIKLPPGVSKAYFSLYLGRCNRGSMGGYFDGTPATVTFGGLVGSSPIITYNIFDITHDNNSSLTFDIQGEVASSFEFEKLIIDGRYVNRTFDTGVKWYEPLSYAVPLGTKSIYPKFETFVMLGYRTKQITDPGRFVIIN